MVRAQGSLKRFPGRWLPFEEARSLVRSHNLQNRDEYQHFNRSLRPKNVPTKPWVIYADEYRGLNDFCGYTNYGRWRRVSTEPVPDRSVCDAAAAVRNRFRQEDGVRWFRDRVAHLCPEFEFVAAPALCCVSVFFRLKTDTSSGAVWLPLRLSFSCAPRKLRIPVKPKEQTAEYKFKIGRGPATSDVSARVGHLLIGLRDELLQVRGPTVVVQRQIRWENVRVTCMENISEAGYLSSVLVALWKEHADAARSVTDWMPDVYRDHRKRLRSQFIKKVHDLVYEKCGFHLQCCNRFGDATDAVLDGHVRLSHRMIKWSRRPANNRVELSHDLGGVCTPYRFDPETSPHFVVALYPLQTRSRTRLSSERSPAAAESDEAELRGMWVLPRSEFLHCFTHAEHPAYGRTTLPIYRPDAVLSKPEAIWNQKRQLRFFIDLSTPEELEIAVGKVKAIIDAHLGNCTTRPNEIFTGESEVQRIQDLKASKSG
ncbi:unnamed protein product [Amoebophrya sp. A120]|nr:unnamed protein product [Amoebophrya sp. A120]|eukprot:GSA120T00016854001.1